MGATSIGGGTSVGSSGTGVSAGFSSSGISTIPLGANFLKTAN